MKEFTYVITDEQGIHARPAGLFVKGSRSGMNVTFRTGDEALDAKFVKEAAACECSVTIGKGGKEVDAKRILGVMSLGVKKGEEITLKTDGVEEEAAMEKLSAFLKENL